MVKRTLLFLVLAGALIAALWFSQRKQPSFRISGFIEADEIRVGSRVGGRVASVHVAEGQVVTKGHLLVELEPFDLLDRLSEASALRAQSQATLDRLKAGFRPEEIAQAKARVEQLTAGLEKLQHGPRPQEIDTARAELQLAQSELDLATKNFQRAEALVTDRGITRERFDTARTEVRVARSRLQVKQEALTLLMEGTRQEDIDQAKAQVVEAEQAWKLQQNGYRLEEVAEAQAAVDAADAAEKVIRRKIDELQIVAPVDGTIEAIELQPGDLVGAGAPVISLMDTSRLWVRAYVPENRLNLRINQEVPVTVSSYRDKRFRGKITFIAREAEFIPRNVQTPEERSKQVFRCKVELLDGLNQLRPGMSADVHLEEALRNE